MTLKIVDYVLNDSSLALTSVTKIPELVLPIRTNQMETAQLPVYSEILVNFQEFRVLVVKVWFVTVI
jgi:hypothetical protein